MRVVGQFGALPPLQRRRTPLDVSIGTTPDTARDRMAGGQGSRHRASCTVGGDNDHDAPVPHPLRPRRGPLVLLRPSHDTFTDDDADWVVGRAVSDADGKHRDPTAECVGPVATGIGRGHARRARGIRTRRTSGASAPQVECEIPSGHVASLAIQTALVDARSWSTPRPQHRCGPVLRPTRTSRNHSPDDHVAPANTGLENRVHFVPVGPSATRAPIAANDPDVVNSGCAGSKPIRAGLGSTSRLRRYCRVAPIRSISGTRRRRASSSASPARSSALGSHSLNESNRNP